MGHPESVTTEQLMKRLHEKRAQKGNCQALRITGAG